MGWEFFDAQGNKKFTDVDTSVPLDNLSNVNTGGKATNDIITWDGTAWSNSTLPAHTELTTDLDDLRDVDFTPSQWDGLVRNGAGGWEALADAFSGHYWRVYRTGSVGLSNATFTDINWQAKASDDVSPTSLITFNSTTVTVAKGGLYLVNAQLNFTSNGTGIRYVRIMTDGTQAAAHSQIAHVTTNNNVQCVAWCSLGAGQTVSVQGYQNSGGTLNVNAGINATWFGGVLVREYDLV